MFQLTMDNPPGKTDHSFMPLPVLRNNSSTAADFVRLFHQSQLEWCRHLGEETELDFGRWISNPAIHDCDDANCLLDAFLTPGISPAEVFAQMEKSCGTIGTPWRLCSLNPSSPFEQTDRLIESLQAAGWKSAPVEILYQREKKTSRALASTDLTIIPARASYRHYRQLMEMRQPGWVEIALLHLDDSHVDSLLALNGHEPVGCISILTTGEVATVREWFVAQGHHRRGIGGLLLDRALEICARGLIRHVMIGLQVECGSAMRICAERGFSSIGQWKAFRR